MGADILGTQGARASATMILTEFGSPHINSLRPRQNGRHFADDIFNCISLLENIWIPIKISLKFVPEGPINNIPALVRIMTWRRPGDKPLSEPMIVSLPTHICVIRPQWVKGLLPVQCQSIAWNNADLSPTGFPRNTATYVLQWNLNKNIKVSFFFFFSRKYNRQSYLQDMAILLPKPMLTLGQLDP